MGELKPKGHVDPNIDEKTRLHIGAGRVRETTRIEEPYENQRVWRSLPRPEVKPVEASGIKRVLTEEDQAALAVRSAEAARPLEEIEYPEFVKNNGYDIDETGPPLLSDREVALELSKDSMKSDSGAEVKTEIGANASEERVSSKKFDLTPSKSTDTHKVKGWSSTFTSAVKITFSLWVMLIIGTHLGTNFGFDEFFPGSTVLTALLLIFGGIAIIAKGRSPIAAKKERYWLIGGSLLLTGVINLTASGFFSSQWLLTFFGFF